MGAGIDQAALLHGAVVGILHRRLPHLVQDVDVADTHRLEARLVVDRHVFDRGADALEDAANDVGHDDLARPVLDGNLDRFIAVGPLAVPASARTAADSTPTRVRLLSPVMTFSLQGSEDLRPAAQCGLE